MFEQFETQGVLELKLIRAIDQIELTGLVFGKQKEKSIRVYFRIGEQNFKDKEPKANHLLAKPLLKLRPLDTSNMAYFTESTRRGRNGQKQTSLLFMHIEDLLFNNSEIQKQMESIETDIYGEKKIPAAHLKSEPNLHLVANSHSMKKGSFANLRQSQQRRSIAVSNNVDENDLVNESDLPDLKKVGSHCSPVNSNSNHHKRPQSINSSNSRFSAATPFNINRSQAGNSFHVQQLTS